MSAPAFPSLRTGAVLQYPSARALSYRTEVSRFVDGSEQRYRQFASVAPRWVVRLNLLSDLEIQAVLDFHLANRGRAAVFSFTDPWSGDVYSTCCFESDDLDIEVKAESQSRTQFVIRSIRE